MIFKRRVCLKSDSLYHLHSFELICNSSTDIEECKITPIGLTDIVAPFVWHMIVLFVNLCLPI